MPSQRFEKTQFALWDAVLYLRSTIFFEPMLDYRIKVRLTFCESSFISILGAWYENQC